MSKPKRLKLLAYLSNLIVVAILLTVIFVPQPAHADWPPFKFRLLPSYENGKIVYNIRFSSETDLSITNLTFKIPLPHGTRFLEAKAQPTTQVSFDGAEVTFFTAVAYQSIKDAYFVVEVTDQTKTTFTTRAWTTWQGNQPGDYLTEDEVIDITQQPLHWMPPARSRLQLAANATVVDDIITYTIYPTNVTGQRLWDLKVNISIPEETTFLSAEAPSSFVTSFDGREVSFSTLELKSRTEIGPLRFKVSSQGVAAPFVTTHVWASWKNVGPSVGRSIPLREEIRSGDIIVRPHTAQQVVPDMIGDVPFSNYDLRSLSLGNDGANLEIIFYTAAEVGPAGQPLEYILYIDQDCRTDTGLEKSGRGVEYRVRYSHNKAQTDLHLWDGAKEDWSKLKSASPENAVEDNKIVVWMPANLLEHNQQFCWTGEVRNKTEEFTLDLPNDNVPDNDDYRLTQYEVVTIPAETQITVANSSTQAVADDADLAEPASLNVDNGAVPASLTTPSRTSLHGKLAVPLDNGPSPSSVHIFSIPDGREIAAISNAHQPHIRYDGQRMLINHEGGGIENVYEYNFADGTKQQVSDSPSDARPFYESWGNRIVYENSALATGADGRHHPYIYVQCSLLPPHEEKDPRCRNLPWLGVLVPAGQMGEIQGSYPVWTAGNMIAYNGCNSWAGSTACGIYLVSATSTKGFSDGFIPTQLTHDPSDIPTDTKGNMIAFMSRREGNWEVYVMGLDGSGLKNLSNGSTSNDGLPTLSPDNTWAAFVSDRDHQWAVWVAPVTGGPAQKLFDLPSNAPWGDDNRSWTDERISWGP